MFTPLMLAAAVELWTFKNPFSYVLFVLLLCIPFLLMRTVFFKTTKFSVKFALVMLMFVQFIVIMLWMANLYVERYAAPDQVNQAWLLAVLMATLLMIPQAINIYICRPRRQLSEADKMKLKDI